MISTHPIRPGLLSSPGSLLFLALPVAILLLTTSTSSGESPRQALSEDLPKGKAPPPPPSPLPPRSNPPSQPSHSWVQGMPDPKSVKNAARLAVDMVKGIAGLVGHNQASINATTSTLHDAFDASMCSQPCGPSTCGQLGKAFPEFTCSAFVSAGCDCTGCCALDPPPPRPPPPPSPPPPPPSPPPSPPRRPAQICVDPPPVSSSSYPLALRAVPWRCCSATVEAAAHSQRHLPPAHPAALGAPITPSRVSWARMRRRELTRSPYF